MSVFPIRLMQGRLLPMRDGRYQAFPSGEWELELSRAADLGLAGIEWIIDENGFSDNPMTKASGRSRLRKARHTLGLKIDSVCADIFMTKHLLDSLGDQISTSVRDFIDILNWCSDLEMRYVILPFVDSSRLVTVEELNGLRNLLSDVAAKAAQNGVEVHLETDLAPTINRDIVVESGFPWIALNYDIGNSASLGHSFQDEFGVFGSLVRSVHVKDRIRGGSTVPLGDGDADIRGVFEQLFRVDYQGDLVLQVARSREGDEINWVRFNKGLVSDLLNEAASSWRST
jgi:L-ribulose-5-phosphate 3-epimerase